jgi:hypothetical protein
LLQKRQLHQSLLLVSNYDEEDDDDDDTPDVIVERPGRKHRVQPIVDNDELSDEVKLRLFLIRRLAMKKFEEAQT